MRGADLAIVLVSFALRARKMEKFSKDMDRPAKITENGRKLMAPSLPLRGREMKRKACTACKRNE